MIVEVIAIRAEDVVAAEAAGADRIELVTGMAEGGLTPSAGMIEAAVKASKLPIYVMIRPHDQSFCYSEADQAAMMKDILICRELGAAGIVLGMLDESGEIDTIGLERMLAAAEGLDVTFHRAIDEVKDQLAALHVLARYPQISRVLTSGGSRTSTESTGQLRRLQEEAQALGIRIIVGKGLTPDNVAMVVRETGVSEVHFGAGVRKNKSFQDGIDPEEIGSIRDKLPG
ncbi:copper homeostasis protein CutC [Paenibacillus sp. HB172176]|uniref:copper homeostasis protein CutC n=1 Tax=Paenibacillus sp. HB172176 TaxID=2493690 RepID=UPI001438B2FB|nr:copper homeostasis protein CutC [Paenibacillus sp. HB172176]